jgi:peroxiredoxin
MPPSSHESATPQVGDPAPDVTLPTADGTTIALSALWTQTEHGLVLVFLRHFG